MASFITNGMRNFVKSTELVSDSIAAIKYNVSTKKILQNLFNAYVKTHMACNFNGVNGIKADMNLNIHFGDTFDKLTKMDKEDGVNVTFNPNNFTVEEFSRVIDEHIIPRDKLSLSHKAFLDFGDTEQRMREEEEITNSLAS